MAWTNANNDTAVFGGTAGTATLDQRDGLEGGGDGALPAYLGGEIDVDGSQRAPHGVFPESDVWSPFGAGLLERLWHLWEATLTATPTLVLARTPGQASAFVAALLAAR